MAKRRQWSNQWGESSFGDYGINLLMACSLGAYDGIYAFNWTNGEIVWKYSSPAYQLSNAPTKATAPASTHDMANVQQTRIADGNNVHLQRANTQLVGNNKRMEHSLLQHNLWQGICIFSGQQSQARFADGYLTAANSWDGYMYVYGKGLTSTTVTASPKTIPNGAQVLIEGTVLDQSPAQPGTPCVSKDSMTTQMEYLHMQQPIGGIWGNATILGPSYFNSSRPLKRQIILIDTVSQTATRHVQYHGLRLTRAIRKSWLHLQGTTPMAVQAVNLIAVGALPL
jgi:hypothetical protein